MFKHTLPSNALNTITFYFEILLAIQTAGHRLKISIEITKIEVGYINKEAW